MNVEGRTVDRMKLKYGSRYYVVGIAALSIIEALQSTRDQHWRSIEVCHAAFDLADELLKLEGK